MMLLTKANNFYCYKIENAGATIHTENGLMLYAKKRTAHSVAHDMSGHRSSATLNAGISSRSHTPSELKYLVAAEEVSLSASKCPLSKFT